MVKSPIFILMLAGVLILSGCSLSSSISLPTEQEISNLGYVVSDFTPSKEDLKTAVHYNVDSLKSESFDLQKNGSEKYTFYISVMKDSTPSNKEIEECLDYTNRLKDIYQKLEIGTIGERSCVMQETRYQETYIKINFQKGDYYAFVQAQRKNNNSWDNSEINLSDIIQITKILESKLD